MILSLEVKRARKGDCLLLHWGSAADPGLAIVDGGPAGVHRSELRPRLREIRSSRGGTGHDPLRVDLVLVTHVDDDHIHGILDLTNELVEAQDERRAPPLVVRACWHNAFEDIVGVTGVSSRPQDPVDAEGAGDGPRQDDVHRILAGLEQGQRLRDDLRKLHIPLNPHFDGGIVPADGSPAKVVLERGLELTVLGPLRDEMDALRARHAAWWIAKSRTGPGAEPAAFTDRSALNLSSIVTLAEAGGRKILLTGDARGDKVMLGLEAAGLLTTDGGFHVDILKVPHHGSANNVEPAFFHCITADHYVFSGNGEHGNPERDTLEMLLDACADRTFTMHFTYPIDEIDAGREKDRVKRFGAGHRDRAWDPGLDGLTSLFRSRGLPRNGQSIACVGAAPYLIDLLSPTAT